MDGTPCAATADTPGDVPTASPDAVASSVVASNATSNSKPKVRKTMALRSPAWEQFDRIVREDGKIIGKCRLCSNEILCPSKNGTSGLWSHMNTCKKKPHTTDTSQSEIDGYVNDGGKKGVGVWWFDQDAARKAIAEMIIEDELPFSFVEKPGFRKVITTIQIRCKVPSRTTISRVCYQLYLDEKKKLVSFLAANCQRVCLTTDTWTSIQRINYMCLTAHFIDNEWKLNKKILNFCPISSHKGEALGRALEVCLSEWGINKVFTITVDNASSNNGLVAHIKKKMMQWGTGILDGEFIHVRCVAHILNLMVQDGLKTLGKSLSKIREAVRYVRQSPSRLEKFRMCAEKEKIDTNSLLCLDVCTRWNSTYLMLEAACKFEKAFDAYVHVDPFYKIELQARASKKDRGNQNESVSMLGNEDDDEEMEYYGIPTEEDWVSAKRLSKFLKYFYDLTCFISGSRYVTSNAYFEEVTNVACLLKKWRCSTDIELSLLADTMFSKFNKYWGDVQKFNSLFYIAVVLDPRSKLEFVELGLTDLYDDKIGENLGLKVKEDMKRIFLVYCDIYGPKKKSNVGVGSSSISSSDISFHNEEGDELKNERKQRLKKMRLEAGAFRNKSELDTYLLEEVVQDEDDFMILDWWKAHSCRYPILSRMARDVLAVPICTVASESAFSTGGRVLDSFRSSLTPRVVQSLICAQDWLRSSKEAIQVEENINELDKWETEYAGVENESTIVEL